MSLQMAQGVTLVTGSARLARHLSWHADRQQAAGKSHAWPSADVLSWTAWLERLWRDSVIVDGVAGQFDLLTNPQSRYVWQKVVSQNLSTELVSEQSSPVVIGLLMDAWRLSRSWDISLDSVARYAAGPDSDAFAQWGRKYETVCRQRQWIDTATVADLVLQDLGESRIAPGRPIAFAGFEHWTPQNERMRRWLESMRLLQPGPERAFRSSRRLAIECSDPQQEFELAARWSRNQIDRHGARPIGVLVPDGVERQARRIFLDVLTPGWRKRPRDQLPVRLARGRPLAASGLIHVALLLLDLPDGFMNYRNLGQLLRTPYIADALDEGTQRAALDVRLRDEGMQEIELRALAAGSGNIADETVQAPTFRRLLRRALDWEPKLSGRHEPGQWAGVVTRLLDDLGWASGRALGNDELQARDTWSGLLDAFAASSPMIGSISFRQVRRLLAGMARDHRSEPDGRLDGVQIMTVREARGHAFDALWICGLSSDAWPPMPMANPLVPAHLQRARGVPEASPAAIRAAAEESMRSLLESAPLVNASWPHRRDHEVLVGSPVLDEFTACSPESIEIYKAPMFCARVFASRRIESLIADPAPPLRDDEQIRGGSQLLKMQSACPARAFFEARLGATELPVPAYGLDARMRGIIIHDALAKLYSQIADHGGLSRIADDDIGSWIDESIDRSLRRHFPARHPLRRSLARNERRRMHVLLWQLIDMDRARSEFLPESLECAEPVGLGPLVLTVRQDRIDRVGAHGHLVIDYKTGRSFSLGAWRGVRPAEPQLPLYAATAQSDGIAVVLLNQDGVTLSGVGREALGLKSLQSPARFADDPDADWGRLLQEWQANLAHLAEEFAAGDVRINRLDSAMAAKEFAMLTRIHDRSVMYLIGAEE